MGNPFVASDVEYGYFAAKILDAAQGARPLEAAGAVWQEARWPKATIEYFPASHSNPAFLLAYEQYALWIALEGTGNWQQGARQAFGSIFFPIATGLPYTNAHWLEVAESVFDRVTQRRLHHGRGVYIVGHSYGAGVAMNLAALFAKYRGSFSLGVTTYGCPQPGTAALIHDLAGVSVVRWQNDRDPVCFLPYPNADAALALGPVLAPSAYVSWGLFDQPGGGRSLNSSGQWKYSKYPANTTAPSLSEIAAWGIGTNTVAAQNHPLHNYVTRLGRANGRAFGIIMLAPDAPVSARIPGVQQYAQIYQSTALAPRATAAALAPPPPPVTLINMAAQQAKEGADMPYVPPQYRAVVRKITGGYEVNWEGTQIATATTRSKCMTLAKYINKTLRYFLGMQAVSYTGLSDAWPTWANEASAGGLGFNPVMNQAT